MSLKVLRKHLSSHEQQLALFALPLQIDEEQAKDDGEYDQQNMADENDSDQSCHLSSVQKIYRSLMHDATNLNSQKKHVPGSASSSPKEMREDERRRLSGCAPLPPSGSCNHERTSSNDYNLTVVTPRDNYYDLADHSASSHASSGASGSTRRRKNHNPARKRKEAEEESLKQVRFHFRRPKAHAKERAESQLAENLSPSTTGKPTTQRREAIGDTASAESLNQLYISGICRLPQIHRDDCVLVSHTNFELDNVKNTRNSSPSELDADIYTDGTIRRQDERTISPSRSCTPPEVAKGKSCATSISLEL